VSSRVSRFHCCLSRIDDLVAIRDLASNNGTRVNGQRVAAGSLRAGDELAIAHLCYRLQFHEANDFSTPCGMNSTGPTLALGG
jgi:hypothetical protein